METYKVIFPSSAAGNSVQYRAHTENVVVQSIQDEVVLVNLESGIYYFLTGSAALIFSALDSGCPQDKLLDLLSDYYGTDVQPFEADIKLFVQRLMEETLLIEGVGTSGLNAHDFLSKPFVSPILNKCDDLQELLLLDPVLSRLAFGGQTSD